MFGKALLSKLLQISIDGPSVNWKFLDYLTKNHNETHNKKLTVSGGLHVICKAFQTGSEKSRWNLNVIFRSLYGLF